MKKIGISITFIMAVFVFISCQTSKDRTDRIDMLYSDGCTNGSFLCPANVLFECIDHNWKLLQYCDLQTCNYITGKCEGEIDDTENTDDADSADAASDDFDDNDDTGNTGLDEDADIGNTGNTGAKCTGSDKFCHSHDGLNWSDASSSEMPWDEAITYCDYLGGRLPDITELRTIIINCPGTMTGGACAVNEPDHLALSDWTEAYCFCDGNADSYSVLGDGKETFLWSSSERSDGVFGAWRVGFTNGIVHGNGKYGSSYVRCVR